jgi:hypothetical protein
VAGVCGFPRNQNSYHLAIPLLNAAFFLSICSLGYFLLILVRKHRREELYGIVVCCLVLLIIILTDVIAEAVKQPALIVWAERGSPLVSAIREFERIHHRLPSTLEELAPEFVGKVPSADPAGHFYYQYRRITNEHLKDQSRWILYVSAPPTKSGARILVYPASIIDTLSEYKGKLHTIGDWIYVDPYYVRSAIALNPEPPVK